VRPLPPPFLVPIWLPRCGLRLDAQASPVTCGDSVDLKERSWRLRWTRAQRRCERLVVIGCRLAPSLSSWCSGRTSRHGPRPSRVTPFAYALIPAHSLWCVHDLCSLGEHPRGVAGYETIKSSTPIYDAFYGCRWSPDGTKIIYTSNRGGGGDGVGANLVVVKGGRHRGLRSSATTGAPTGLPFRAADHKPSGPARAWRDSRSRSERRPRSHRCG
jgi:hypothetical protein